MNEKNTIAFNTVLITTRSKNNVPNRENIYVDTIMYCEKELLQSKIFLNTGTNIFAEHSIVQLTNKLPMHKFLRVSTSHLVNIDFVQHILVSTVCNLCLHNGTQILVSSAKKKSIVSLFKNNIK